MENQKGHNQDAGKKVWTTPKLDVLSQRETFGGTGFDPETFYGLYSE